MVNVLSAIVLFIVMVILIKWAMLFVGVLGAFVFVWLLIYLLKRCF
jgi:hypothetical protein